VRACKSVILFDWTHMILFEGELWRKFETFTDCFFCVSEMTQEMRKSQLQGALFRNWKCTDYERINLLEGEAQEKSRIFTETSFCVFEKME
jgi:hypothetical protein